MSYALAFAPDARSQWRELDPELQEGVLDELERVADKPPPGDEFLRDFVRHEPGGDRYIFVRVVVDRRRSVVVLTGVLEYLRPPGRS